MLAVKSFPLEILSYFLSSAQKRKSCQQTDTAGVWEAQVSSTPDWVLLICPPLWTPCGDLISVHCSPTYFNGILLPNTADSRIILSVKRHFFQKHSFVSSQNETRVLRITKILTVTTA